MRFNQSQFLFIALFLMLTTFACKKDARTACADSFNFSLELQAESTNISAAATVYANDPTPENCEAYKSAFQEYLDAARDLSDCARAVGQLTEYNASLDAAEVSIMGLECN